MYHDVLQKPTHLLMVIRIKRGKILQAFVLMNVKLLANLIKSLKYPGKNILHCSTPTLYSMRSSWPVMN